MNEKTSVFLDESRKTISGKIIGDNTANSFSGMVLYGTALPSNINVFSNLTDGMIGLEDAGVREQVKQVLSYLYLSLLWAHKQKTLNSCFLSRVNIVQQSDKSALLEWSFQDFRVGFTLESNSTESSYFIISQNKNTGSLIVDTQKLNVDVSKSIDKIVKYVLENT